MAIQASHIWKWKGLWLEEGLAVEAYLRADRRAKISDAVRSGVRGVVFGRTDGRVTMDSQPRSF